MPKPNKKTEPKKDSTEVKKGGATPSRDILYAEAAKYAPRAIEVIAEIMNKGDNDSNRLGAAKTILAKSIPDQKAMEITGPDGGPLQLKYIVDLAGGYIPPLGAFNGPSGGGNPGSASVQGAGVAQAGTQDNNSSNGTGQTGPL